MLRLFKTYLKPYWLLVVLACVFTFVQVLAELQLPAIMADIVDVGVYNSDLGYVLAKGFTMLAWALLSAAAVVVAALCAARSAMAFGRDVRHALFRKVESCSMVEFNDFGTSTLITRNTNDVQQVERFTQMLMTMAVMTPAMLVGACIMAFATNREMAGLMFVAMPLIAVIVAVLLKVGLPLLRSLQARIDAVNRVMREGLTGVRVVRAYNREEHERARFGKVNRDLSETYVKVGRLMGAAMPLMVFVVNLTIVALYWFGASAVDAGTLSAGEIMALVQYVTLVLMSLMMLSMIFALLPRTLAASERIDEVLSIQPAISDATALGSRLEGVRAGFDSCGHAPQSTNGVASATLLPMPEDVVTPAAPLAQAAGAPYGEAPTIALDHVEYCFSGADRSCVTDIDFSCQRGTFNVLLGPTGSGKSVVVSLMLRLLDPLSGTVRFNGVDERSVPQAELRRRIAYVPQKATLFTGTIAENVRMGAPDATDEQVWKALEDAQAADFVQGLEGGVDFRVAQGGQNLSGGQRQRLAIARALLKDADLYLFDDSFSALDFKTDAQVRTAVRKRLADKTVLVVSQRVSVALDADQIVLLSEQGGVEALGTHDELFLSCADYRELALSQLSQADLDAEGGA